jgi:glutamine synthetase
LIKDELLEILKSGRVDYVRVEFIDLLGNVRGRSLRRAEFENLILKDSGLPYPESLLMLDYADSPIKSRYGDVLAIPDPSTFIILPYLERTARVLSYITLPDLTPSQFCSRGLLKRAIDKLEEKGLSIRVSFEPTFYLVKENDNSISPADESRAFSPEGLMEEQSFLRDVIKYLESVGVQVETINKHYGPAQYEIRFAEKDALSAADSLVTAREVIRDSARIYKLFSTFMPKPFSNYPSSSMDVYIKLTSNDGKDIMSNINDPKGLGLSEIAYNFLAGIIEHIGSIMAFASPTINSYKRFRETVTPSLLGLGTERHFVIRMPSNFRDSKSVEFRLADPLANSYLLLSAIIYAGLDGIERKLDVEPNVELGSLPSNLEDALHKLDSDNYIKYSIGAELISSYIELKNREIESYNNYITDWEVKAYLKAGW